METIKAYIAILGKHDEENVVFTADTSIIGNKDLVIRDNKSNINYVKVYNTVFDSIVGLSESTKITDTTPITVYKSEIPKDNAIKITDMETNKEYTLSSNPVNGTKDIDLVLGGLIHYLYYTDRKD